MYRRRRRHPHPAAHHGAGRVPRCLEGEEVAGTHSERLRVLGNAATRIETFVLSTGTYAYGGYPISTRSLGSRRWKASLAGARRCSIRCERLMQERVMHAPIFEPR